MPFFFFWPSTSLHRLFLNISPPLLLSFHLSFTFTYEGRAIFTHFLMSTSLLSTSTERWLVLYYYLSLCICLCNCICLRAFWNWNFCIEIGLLFPPFIPLPSLIYNFLHLFSLWVIGKLGLVTPSLTDSGVAVVGPSYPASSGTGSGIPSAVDTATGPAFPVAAVAAAAVASNSATVANSSQKASIEAAMMAKALASLTAGAGAGVGMGAGSGAGHQPSSQGTNNSGGGGGGINKPAILSAILRTAAPGNTNVSKTSKN